MFDRARAIRLIEARRCACPRCPGHLSDPTRSPHGWGHCRLCHCAWRVEYMRDGRQLPLAVPSAQGCPVWDDKARDPAGRWR